MQEWSDDPITVNVLARRLGISASSTSEIVRKISARGLLSHVPYGSVDLTAQGRDVALSMVRRHRLLELFLFSCLGYSWDQVHDEAEELEHAVSDLFVSRLSDYLGHPERDPHGDPIPDADGRVPKLPARHLLTLDEGIRCRVARVSDADPALLRYLLAEGLELDAFVTISERRDFAGTLVIQLDGKPDPLELGSRAAAAVWVVPLEPE